MVLPILIYLAHQPVGDDNLAAKIKPVNEIITGKKAGKRMGFIHSSVL